MTSTARDAAQDVAVAVDAVADAMTWRELAHQAIHALAAAHAEHEALRGRYARLLADYRALRPSTPRRAA